VKWVKQNIVLLIIVIIGVFTYQKMFPNIETKIVTKYKKGTTDTLIVKKDSLIYVPKYTIKVKTDTVYVDSSGEHASAKFNLQDSVVTGVVHYDTPLFSFYNVKVRQKIINNYIDRVDTLRINTTKTIHNKFHIGLVGGYGVGLQDSKFQPFVGIGFLWEIF